MPDNFGRMTSNEAPQSLKDSCFPKSKTCRICGETPINNDGYCEEHQNSRWELIRGQYVRVVKCDGWASDLGCDKVCIPTEWTGKYGGRQLCPKCAQRLKDDNRSWAWLTR